MQFMWNVQRSVLQKISDKTFSTEKCHFVETEMFCGNICFNEHFVFTVSWNQVRISGGWGVAGENLSIPNSTAVRTLTWDAGYRGPKVPALNDTEQGLKPGFHIALGEYPNHQATGYNGVGVSLMSVFLLLFLSFFLQKIAEGLIFFLWWNKNKFWNLEFLCEKELFSAQL